MLGISNVPLINVISDNIFQASTETTEKNDEDNIFQASTETTEIDEETTLTEPSVIDNTINSTMSGIYKPLAYSFLSKSDKTKNDFNNNDNQENTYTFFSPLLKKRMRL